MMGIISECFLSKGFMLSAIANNFYLDTTVPGILIWQSEGVAQGRGLFTTAILKSLAQH